jgi:hypothetical protein
MFVLFFSPNLLELMKKMNGLSRLKYSHAQNDNSPEYHEAVPFYVHIASL